MEHNRKYDMLLLLKPDLEKEEVERITDKFAEAAQNNGGKVVKRSFWGKKNLAYEVNRHDKGVYYLFHLEAPAACVAELSRLLKISQEVIKFLITKVEVFTDPFGRTEEVEKKVEEPQPEAEAATEE